MGTAVAARISESGNHVPDSTAPSKRIRIWVALAVGLASAIFTAVAFARPDASPDFEFWWRGAQILLAGDNPYLMAPNTQGWSLPDPLFYPLPTLILTAPLSWLSLPLAGAVFMGTSGGLLAWLVTRDGLWRLWMFGTASYFMACKVGQWSPLIMAVAFLPGAGFLAAMKPNLGLALLSYRPSRDAILGCIAVGLVSFALLPSWLLDWHTNTASLVGHPPPILTPVGALVLLALLRWRRPEARLLLAMACVPQLLFFADQLPLFLIPRTRREMMTLTLCSAIGFFVWYIRFADNPAYVLAAAPYVIWSSYIPCLAMVLRRPNAGDTPGWIDRALARVVRFTSRRPYSTSSGRSTVAHRRRSVGAWQERPAHTGKHGIM
jgi:hypothetical protein